MPRQPVTPAQKVSNPFRDLIDRLVKEKGVSLNQLADLAGMKRSNLGTTLRTGNPQLKMLLRLAKALDVDPAALIPRRERWERFSVGEPQEEAPAPTRAFMCAPIGLCQFDRELRYLRINNGLAAINGLPVEEHLGRKITDVLPDVANGVERELRHVLETGEPIVNGFVEATTPAHPTSTRTYMHNYFPDRSANGAVIGISCVVQDVSEAKGDLAEALRELQSVLERALLLSSANYQKN